ncbi:MAG: nucleotide exchange factor GrpE [Cyclobacteriaceae bacterium]|nr:nucleotide exchange factor GrpE [Cyclobacteriaceae bacterium]
MTKKKKEDKSTIADKKSAEQVAEQEEVKTSTEGAEEENEEVEVDEVEKLTGELAEAKDKYLRLYSEFDNYRRRTAKERLDLMLTAGEKIIAELIPVLDDFERAVKSADSKDEKSVLEGLTLISQKFEKTMQNQGLKVMETPEGTEFDPDIHEAITQIPAPKKKLQGKIVDTIEKGYYLGEKVIRFAKVVTGS